MFGFGDDQNPYTESVDLLEDLVIEYITEMVVLLLPFKLFQILIYWYMISYHKILFIKLDCKKVYFRNVNVSSYSGNWQRVSKLIRII